MEEIKSNIMEEIKLKTLSEKVVNFSDDLSIHLTLMEDGSLHSVIWEDGNCAEEHSFEVFSKELLKGIAV